MRGRRSVTALPGEVVQDVHRRRPVFGSVAEALRMTRAGLDYLNGPGAGELEAAACGRGAAVAG